MIPLPPPHPCPDCNRKHRTPEEHDKLREHFENCAHCGLPFYYDYHVKDDVWAASGLDFHAGTLHLPCLEKLIGRRLALDDFIGPSRNPNCKGQSPNDIIRWAFERGSAS